MLFWLLSWIWLYGWLALCTFLCYLGSAMAFFGRINEPYATVLVSLCTVAGFTCGLWLMT